MKNLKNKGGIKDMKNIYIKAGFLFICIIILAVVIFCVLWYLDGRPKLVEKKTIVTQYGDVLDLVQKHSMVFTADTYKLEIVDNKSKKNIAILTSDHFINMELKPIIKKDKYRYYLIEDTILCKNISTNIFAYEPASLFDVTNPQELKLYLPAVKELVKTNEWKWIYYFADYLIESKDTDFVDILKQYASRTNEGIFKTVKKDYGSGFILTYEDMVKMSKELLEKHSI